jgi:hypothetical protein
LSNHPASGGSHLPDITVITPVYEKGVPVFFVASRGHHAVIIVVVKNRILVESVRDPCHHFLESYQKKEQQLKVSN